MAFILFPIAIRVRVLVSHLWVLAVYCYLFLKHEYKQTKTKTKKKKKTVWSALYEVVPFLVRPECSHDSTYLYCKIFYEVVLSLLPLSNLSCRLQHWRYTISEWEYHITRSCWSMQWWSMGNSVWQLLEQSWCSCNLQTTGILKFR